MVDKQRILIVDDDENIAELISLYLMKECYDTKIVGDGESALKEVPVFKPNLILLDLMLPGMDGYQVCREIRTTSQVPIIMLSAKGEIIGYEFVNLGKMMESVKKGVDANEALEKAKSHYGQWDSAAKYIDPRQE